MNNRERTSAVLHYQSYDRMPVVSFGYWAETLDKWAKEGYISQADAEDYRLHGDSSDGDRHVMDQLGFDFNWNRCMGGNTGLFPGFKPETLKTYPDGSRLVRDGNGLLTRVNDRIVSIPAMMGTSLTGREAWEELYLPRLKYSDDRVDDAAFRKAAAEDAERDLPLGAHVGSLYGKIRDMLGVEELSYLAVDDENLYADIIDTIGNLCYQVAEKVFSYGIRFEYAHFWEDICFKNGPLINPRVFREMVGPHYKRITELAKRNGIDIVSLDCDGCIDLLVPVWLDNGVNTMFPIEVGVWNASIAPWRGRYGKDLHGVGGMDKRVFAHDKAAVDAEIERLKKLVDMGGYIPCPDHRIAPDAKFELVEYYCKRFREEIR